MNESKISTRYAKALFLTAIEKKKLEDIKKDMSLISVAITENDELNQIIESPVVKKSEKALAITSLFKGKVNDITIAFLDLVIKNKRETYLVNIARNFNALYKNHKGLKEAFFTSTTAIDAKLQKEIAAMVKDTFKAEIELQSNVKEDLVGGFVLRVEDQQYDASVATKLKNIKRELLNKRIN